MAESLVVTSVRRIYAEETSHPSLSSSNIPIPCPASGVDETPNLWAFGEPIPPSQVAAMAKANGIPKPDGNADPESIKSYESATWEYLRQVIDKLVESADSTNLKSIVAQLFAENIVRGRSLFASACLRCQSKNPQLTPVYAALAGLVNTYFPSVGDILYRRLRFKVSEMLTGEYDEEFMKATTKFLSHLVNLRVVWVAAAVTLLHHCLEKETEEHVKLAVTLFEELKLPGYGDNFGDVHHKFTRIKNAENLKKEIRDMAAFVVAKETWNHVFSEGSIVPPELDWVISLLKPPTYHFESKNPATNQDIFLGDEYKPDKDFLKRERAYNLFRSIVLREYYWHSFSCLPLKEKKYLSKYDKVARTSRTKDQQSIFRRLLPIIRRQDEVQVSLGILKYSCLMNQPLSLFPLIEFLCNTNKGYKEEAWETCFLVIWLMVAGSPQFTNVAATSFAELLHRGLLSWGFVARLSFEPQDLTHLQYEFLKVFLRFYTVAYDRSHLMPENIFRWNCPCVPAAITFFKSAYLDEVAAELEKLWKENNCIETTKAAQFNKRNDMEIASPNEETELREEQQNDDSAQAQQIQHGAQPFGKRKRPRKMPKYLNDFVLP